MQSQNAPGQETQRVPSGDQKNNENIADNLPIVAVEVIPVEVEKMATIPQTHTEGGDIQGSNEQLQTITTNNPTGEYRLY